MNRSHVLAPLLVVSLALAGCTGTAMGPAPLDLNPTHLTSDASCAGKNEVCYLTVVEVKNNGGETLPLSASIGLFNGEVLWSYVDSQGAVYDVTLQEGPDRLQPDGKATVVLSGGAGPGHEPVEVQYEGGDYDDLDTSLPDHTFPFTWDLEDAQVADGGCDKDANPDSNRCLRFTASVENHHPDRDVDLLPESWDVETRSGDTVQAHRTQGPDSVEPGDSGEVQVWVEFEPGKEPAELHLTQSWHNRLWYQDDLAPEEVESTAIVNVDLVEAWAGDGDCTWDDDLGEEACHALSLRIENHGNEPVDISKTRWVFGDQRGDWHDPGWWRGPASVGSGEVAEVSTRLTLKYGTYLVQVGYDPEGYGNEDAHWPVGTYRFEGVDPFIWINHTSTELVEESCKDTWSYTYDCYEVQVSVVNNHPSIKVKAERDRWDWVQGDSSTVGNEAEDIRGSGTIGPGTRGAYTLSFEVPQSQCMKDVSYYHGGWATGERIWIGAPGNCS